MKFNVSDRVKVYGSNTQHLTMTGVVVELCLNTELIRVRPDLNPSSIFTYHVKQCRKLVKKKYMEIFVAIDRPKGMILCVRHERPSLEKMYKDSDSENIEIVHFREVKKK